MSNHPANPTSLPDEVEAYLDWETRMMVKEERGRGPSCAREGWHWSEEQDDEALFLWVTESFPMPANATPWEVDHLWLCMQRDPSHPASAWFRLYEQRKQELLEQHRAA